MINPATIKSFLARKLNDYAWLKKEQLAAVNQVIPDAITLLSNWGILWLHQKICFTLIVMLKRFMLHIDMGGGKSLTVLSVIQYRKQRGEKPKAIIFVPYLTAVETWVEETTKHTPELQCVVLLGSTDDNLARLNNDNGDLFVICYQSAVAMLAEPIKKVGKTKKKWAMDPSRVREAFKSFDTLVMDEIHKAKSSSSLTYKMLRAISSQCEYVIGLTGTPFGRDLQDLWSQFYLIDFGETLGDTLGLYREVFFTKKVNYWGGYEFKFKKNLFSKLQEFIKNKSIRYSIDEFHDMQPREYVLKKVHPHEGIKAYADTAIESINKIAATKGKGQYRALESEYLRLRQLSSGFMTFKGEDDDRVQIKFDENPKLDALQELIEAMPDGCKMIVFHHFVYTNVLISERLTALGIDHARVYGKSRDPIEELRQFKQMANCRCLVINSRSGSSSLNLQHANYIVFFEQPESGIDRSQAERRVWRPGQDKRVWIYDLIMTGTADQQMLKWNKEGESLLTALLDGKTKL